MLGLRVRALGHTGGAVSVTVQAAALALHDERPGCAAEATGQSPAAAMAAAASPENATVLINDAWQWEQARMPRGRACRPGPLGDDREAAGDDLPAWQRVRGAVAAGEGPFGAPAARLARHSSFKWGAAGPLAAPEALYPDPAGPAGSPRPPPAPLASAHAAAIRPPSYGEPQGAAQGAENPGAGATPGASRPCSEAGEGGGALGVGSGAGGADDSGGDDEAGRELQADGFFLEYVLHNAALGPAHGPQVRLLLTE